MSVNRKMQDHWSKVHGDLKDIYEEIAAPEGAKPKEGEDKAAASAKKVRQAIYDIRYRSGQKNLPLNKVYQDYMQGSGMTPKERAMVKAKIASSSQKEEYQFEYHMSTLQFDEQTGKYKVRVTDKTTGKSFIRTATREKISQLRNNPNISSVEMTKGEGKKADKDYDGDGKIESGTDEYMGSRDKAIKKAIAAKKEEVDTQLEVHQDLLNATLDKMEEGVRDLDPKKGTAERKARLEKKRGMKVDDHPEYKKKEHVDEADMKGAPSIKDAKPAKKTNVKYDPHMKVMAPQKEEVEVTEKKDDTYLEPDMKKRQANNEKARKELAKGPQMKNPHFESKEVELPFGDMRGLIKKAAKRVDADVDGDVDAKDKKSSSEMGEYVPTPDGKKKTTRVKEGYSWRDELIEVMGDKMDDDSKKKIDVMKGKNKIKINPPMGEEVDLSDSLEPISEESDKKYCRLCMKKESRDECSYGPKMFDAYSVDDATDGEREVAASQSDADGGGVSESVLYEMNGVEVELISESFIDQVVEEFFVEFVIENDLTEDEIDTLVAEMTLEINESLILTEETDVLLNEKLGMVKKAIKSAGSVAKKAVVGGTGLAARAAGTAVRAVKKAGGVVKAAGSAAKAGYKRGVEGSGSSTSASASTPAPKKSGTPAGKKLVSGLKKVASGTASMVAKAAKKTASAAKGAASVAAKTTKKVVGKVARATSSTTDKVAKKLGEGLSIEDQMRISREANAKRKPYQPGDRQKQRAAQLKNVAKNAKKDTRTDAEKMADATGPRPGSRYRGD